MGIKQMGFSLLFSGSGCALKMRPPASERSVLSLSCNRLRQTCFGTAGVRKGITLGVPFFLHPLTTRHILMTHFTVEGAERVTSWKSKGGLTPAFINFRPCMEHFPDDKIR